MSHQKDARDFLSWFKRQDEKQQRTVMSRAKTTTETKTVPAGELAESDDPLERRLGKAFILCALRPEGQGTELLTVTIEETASLEVAAQILSRTKRQLEYSLEKGEYTDGQLGRTDRGKTSKPFDTEKVIDVAIHEEIHANFKDNRDSIYAKLSQWITSEVCKFDRS